jgi:Predicted membrane protein
MMRRITTLGLDERVERVLAYSLFWVSGLVLLFTEKNKNVRWHAMQSVVTFGTLSLLFVGVSMLNGVLSWIPILGLFISFGLHLLLNILGWLWILLWFWLMVMSWLHPDYRLPIVSKWARGIF